MYSFTLILAVLCAGIHFSSAQTCSDYGTDMEGCEGDAACSWVAIDIEMYECQATSCEADVSNWNIDYVGRSTQFKLFNDCYGNWIKVKMEDLTEYSAATGQKTNNKETAFANADWKHTEGVYDTFRGEPAFSNVFNATLDSNAGGGAGFALTTWLLRQDVNATYTANSIKFSVNVTNWQYLDAANYLVLCVGIMTNNGGSPSDDGLSSFAINDFVISNDPVADCNGNSINVTVSEGGNGNNHLELCYTFDVCDGDIFYDPTVSPPPSNNTQTTTASPSETSTETPAETSTGQRATVFVFLLLVVTAAALN